MMVKPTINELLKETGSRFNLVIVASKRARQIANGGEVLTKTKGESTVTIAAHEIAEGRVKVEQECL